MRKRNNRLLKRRRKSQKNPTTLYLSILLNIVLPPALKREMRQMTILKKNRKHLQHRLLHHPIHMKRKITHQHLNLLKQRTMASYLWFQQQDSLNRKRNQQRLLKTMQRTKCTVIRKNKIMRTKLIEQNRKNKKNPMPVKLKRKKPNSQQKTKKRQSRGQKR